MINRSKIRTLLSLGLRNLGRVGLYRAQLKLGIFARTLPILKQPSGPFLSTGVAGAAAVELNLFSYHRFAFSGPPDWFANRFSEDAHAQSTGHWSKISDFAGSLGDIKTVWELSRMDWAPKLAYEAIHGEPEKLFTLESWLRSWVAQNPTNQGTNWKCGQEASLRALNLLTAAAIVPGRLDEPFEGFLSFLASHGERIAPTMSYAIGQDNNHGTSEAAALYVIGSYLYKHGSERQRDRAKKWQTKGSYWLVERTNHLIMKDGSFSQHSVVYHRMMLSTLCIAELFRRRLGGPKFEQSFYTQARLATDWLRWFTDPVSGDAPNLGANDGTHLFGFWNDQYRDFQSTVELAAVFFGASAPVGGKAHPLLGIFGVVGDPDSLPNPATSQEAKLFEDGGYAVFRTSKSLAVLRLPVYRFRPSQADALHVDLWHQGVNIIQDSGTFSYNGKIENGDSQRMLSSTAAHSTALLDSRDQMPMLSRFLFADWLTPTRIEFDDSARSVTSGYRCEDGRRHERRLVETPTGWEIQDDVSGFSSDATIRWHLHPAEWALKDQTLSSTICTIRVSSDATTEIRLKESPRSRYYLAYENAPVLVVKVKQACTVVTTIDVNSPHD